MIYSSHKSGRGLSGRIAPVLFALSAAMTVTIPAQADPPSDPPLSRAQLWVDPNSAASKQVEEWRSSRPSEASLIQRIAEQPQAVWFGDWNRKVRSDVRSVVDAAAREGAVPVLVAYNIPQRDCGSYSAGGAERADAYQRWIREFAAGIGGRSALVVLEPDAIAGADCLDGPSREQRSSLIREAVEILKGAGASVYIDAGHARWHSPEEIAERLRKAGIDRADGFSLNVSNFHGNVVNIEYGERVSRLTGGKHFVIDTSRNGTGIESSEEWCNPTGQALGSLPSTRTSHPLVDAFLWVKRPGESDGTCNGGPRAGEWWAEYALGLAERQTRSMALAMLEDR